MRTLRTFLTSLAFAALWMNEAEASSDLYTGLTLIDPRTEARLENAHLLVRDGRIAAFGAGAPPASLKADRTHDFSGRHALPGFIDAHAHITATGILKVELKDGAPSVSTDNDPEITQHNARGALALGVTTVRNPGGDPLANASYDRMIASGKWLGPEALHAGAVIQPPPFTGGMFAYPRSEAEWDAEAARQANLGMTYFKLYTDLSEEELATGVRAAHKHGLKAIAHLHEVSWMRAIELGIDGLEHALPTSPDLLEPEARATYLTELGPTSKYMYRWFELADYEGPLMRRTVDLLATKKIAMNLTLIVNELVYNVDDLERVAPPEELRYVHPKVRKVLFPQLQASAAGWTADDFRRARAVKPKVLAFARMLHEAGVPMMIGTDGGGGVFYARELELHRDAGIAAWDVLRMATSRAADILGIGDRTGRIQIGHEADIVFLDADPLDDVGNARKVHGVLNNGRLLLTAKRYATTTR